MEFLDGFTLFTMPTNIKEKIMAAIDFWERDYVLKKYYRNLYKIQDLKEDGEN